jgi:hypothetical protein
VEAADLGITLLTASEADCAAAVNDFPRLENQDVFEEEGCAEE